MAIRGAICMLLCDAYGQLASSEHPVASVMKFFWIFAQLRAAGFRDVTFPYCGYGSPLLRSSWWCSNNGRMSSMSAVCQCPFKGRHFHAQDYFTVDSLADFLSRGDCMKAYGCVPAVGDSVATFAGLYPLRAVRRIARLNKAALDAGDFDAGARPAYSPPQWAVELATSLPYDTLFAYHLARPGHINVNEVRGYKSLM